MDSHPKNSGPTGLDGYPRPRLAKIQELSFGIDQLAKADLQLVLGERPNEPATSGLVCFDISELLTIMYTHLNASIEVFSKGGHVEDTLSLSLLRHLRRHPLMISYVPPPALSVEQVDESTIVESRCQSMPMQI